MDQFVLALDQGTTSSRAIIFGRDGRSVGSAQKEFPQLYPQPGHVEHDPEEIWTTQLKAAKESLNSARLTSNQIAAIGITSPVNCCSSLQSMNDSRGDVSICPVEYGMRLNPST